MNQSENVSFRVHYNMRLRRIVILFNEIAYCNGPKKGICSWFIITEQLLNCRKYSSYSKKGAIVRKNTKKESKDSAFTPCNIALILINKTDSKNTQLNNKNTFTMYMYHIDK